MPKKLIVETMTPEDHADFDARQEASPSTDLLTKARMFATVAHSGQMRKDGKNPYIVHPERVVKVLQDAGVVDPEILAAAYLHDVLEDTKEDISEFPERVQKLVKELTKPAGTKDKNAYIAGFAGKSYEALLIKLADRYDNLLDGSKTMKPDWVVNYLKGADALLLAARQAGVNQKGTGAKLYAKLVNLRDQLKDRASASGQSSAD
jgi:(p)ppGpp synthase/HD superfamily hydrolase